MKQYFTTAIRHLWSSRLFTALNVFGLAVSISACWVIFRIVDYEFSYDRELPNQKKIYRVISGFIFDEKESYNGGVSAPLYQGVREQISGLEYVVPVLGKYMAAVAINHPNQKSTIIEDQQDIVATDVSYFNMLPYRWLAGNKLSALKAPESVVLTESRAKQYFPNKKLSEVLNQTITYYSYRDTVQRTITGIVADFKAPTEFTAQEFCALPTKAYELNSWTNTNASDKLYLQLKPGIQPGKIKKQIESIVFSKMYEFNKKKTDPFKFKRWFQLLPLSESHFSTYIQEGEIRKASKPIMYSLIGIALFLLVLACINYVNLSVASIPQRAKEIGVRKTLGSSQLALIGQFLSETMITTFIAGILSFVFSLLAFGLLKDIIPPGITPITHILQLVLFILILGIVVTALAGFYPAWLITKVKAVNIFRGTSIGLKSSNGFSLQKILIVFQFVIALIFITSALIVGKQLQYALKADMGFKKDAVIVVDVPWKFARQKEYKDKQFALFAELKRIPGIQNLSLGSIPMENGYSSSQYQYKQVEREPIKRQVSKKWVDTAYLSLYDIKLLAGRNLRASDTTNEYVINETAVKAFGFASPQDALGKIIGQEGQMYPVVGVVKDFHQQNFYKPIDPMAFESEKDELNTFNIKLAGNDPAQWQKTLKAVEKTWYQFYPPESYAYRFYDEVIAKLYEQEQHLARLIDLATIVSIFISCLGLFGLAVLTAFQRTKEIGIRKVLGASVSGIVQLLSKEYVWLVLIAFVIASPIVWWAMNKWLQGFAYRIHIQWWMFVTGGIIALILALVTISFQAIKAALANPVDSLRSE
ncbi:MAG: FtsX-like permease family protein [Sphingobacteriaceae bacterium]|nr:MAG: FtsX-like permease family protein [Sphingobacteriaceae bacterium]